MTWIKTIEYEDAEGKLKSLYNRVKGPDGNIDNILKSHSLRPHTLEGHMVMYKNVLHNFNNKLSRYIMEALGLFVSLLNGCSYCVEHHYQGMKKELNDDSRAGVIRVSLENGEPNRIFTGKYLQLMEYAEILTNSPYDIDENIITNLRESGCTDGEILEANQVISYFNYANRTVLGLGVNTDGDILGLSPNDTDDPENWGHK